MYGARATDNMPDLEQYGASFKFLADDKGHPWEQLDLKPQEVEESALLAGVWRGELGWVAYNRNWDKNSLR